MVHNINGYETEAFNRQVKNNIEKFEGEDFMFQLIGSELLRCKKMAPHETLRFDCG